MNSSYETLPTSVEHSIEEVAQALGSVVMPSSSVQVNWFRRDPGGGTVFIKPPQRQTGGEALLSEAPSPLAEAAG